ncbi:hypothetical protein E1B28_001773 [Marasmius oreades]|uniref:Uncharacterized protein n=1 Tax=Marasmius oreades TaxID=181124 RepID=A0A9P7V474_9AGAR|nr:uncharacterized protein E1B28_001773 [Marasmius oreades]KAG7099980.1 hypothetical protein E1B28_001773 [Marasmius oreades]
MIYGSPALMYKYGCQNGTCLLDPNSNLKSRTFFNISQPWLTSIRHRIASGYVAKMVLIFSNDPGASSFDMKTLGGHFTYTAVEEIMSTFKGIHLKKRTDVSLA